MTECLFEALKDIYRESNSKLLDMGTVFYQDIKRKYQLPELLKVH